MCFFSLFCLNAASIQAGFDFRSFDFIFQESLRLDAEASWKEEDTRISGIVRYGKSSRNDLNYIETGILISVYPFKNYGFNIGCSLLKCGFSWGLGALDSDCYISTEAFVGWTISMPWVFIEPRIVFSDSFQSDTVDRERLQSSIKQFSRFRITLLAGVEIK